ncbi:DUF1571 domain-containing protein [Burkholderia ubonensis]|uniref:DUF1571 domain-containing protein n=1 Tax=Burkholderia ubonensis TaxID=101571 RepID=UPI0022B7576D|nr:DUF1571 domain-containing protein [Burkholderia ubonensis]
MNPRRSGSLVVERRKCAPSRRPRFHAKKEVLGLDLHAPWFRTVESYDNDGRPFERIVIEKIAPASFDAAAFDPKNPAYAF